MECLMTKVFALLIKALTLTYRILATIHKINHYKMCHLVSALSRIDHLFSKAYNKLLLRTLKYLTCQKVPQLEKELYSSFIYQHHNIM